MIAADEYKILSIYKNRFQSIWAFCYNYLSLTVGVLYKNSTYWAFKLHI